MSDYVYQHQPVILGFLEEFSKNWSNFGFQLQGDDGDTKSIQLKGLMQFINLEGYSVYQVTYHDVFMNGSRYIQRLVLNIQPQHISDFMSRWEEIVVKQIFAIELRSQVRSLNRMCFEEGLTIERTIMLDEYGEGFRNAVDINDIEIRYSTEWHRILRIRLKGDDSWELSKDNFRDMIEFFMKEFLEIHHKLSNRSFFKRVYHQLKGK